jgi:membrane-bound ClpP family serine protease
MKTRLIIVTLITNLFYEAAIVVGGVWLLPKLGFAMPWWGTTLGAVVFAAWAAFCFRTGWQTLKIKPLGGLTDMIGTEGTATSRLDPVGYIKIDGELWKAQTEKDPIKAGARVVVTGQKELKLVVREEQ